MNSPVYTVWEAVEEGGFLPVGKNVVLEILEHDMDGIFPSIASWKAFVRGNFLSGDYFLDSIKGSTIKKWCRPLGEYSGLFRVKVGADKWLEVDAKELDFTFEYEPYYSRGKIEGLDNFPSMIEITVKATIK